MFGVFSRLMAGLVPILAAGDNIITDFTETLGNWITAGFAWIGNVFNGAASLFWVSGTGFTFLGTLMLMGFAITLITFGIAFIRGFVQR